MLSPPSTGPIDESLGAVKACQPRAAYIHIPFCQHHCWYCDFAVVAGKDLFIDRYLAALEKELATLRMPQAVETIFVGGGTPTHLSCPQLSRLLALLQHWFPLEANNESPGEFTVEANPGTLTEEKIDALAHFGVNRLSLGGQSFQAHVLRFLERDHRPADIEIAVERAGKRGLAISIDLIFGVPGQTLEDWRADLHRAIGLGVEHLSTYGLTYEKGTPLWKARERGEVRPLDEELEREMYERAMDTLTAAGFEHYEISNFAKPGCQSRHNQVYWANQAYFGFGLGAARYINGRREMTSRDLLAYLQKLEAGDSPVRQSEVLSPEERARETASLNLRRAEGIDRTEFRRQTGFDLDALLGDTLRRQAERGLLADDGRRVALTREGKLLADSVMVALWRS